MHPQRQDLRNEGPINSFFCGILKPIVCLAFSFVVAANVQANTGTATVHIRLVDVSGNNIGVGQIDIFKRQADGVDFAKRFLQNTGSLIPFGTYHLRVHAKGFWSTERDVRVSQGDMWIVLQLELGMGLSEGGLQQFKLSGSVLDTCNPNEPKWLRLQGVYSNFLLDFRAADNTGQFAILGIPQGWYTLTTVRGTQIVDLRAINVPVDKPLVIDLAPKGCADLIFDASANNPSAGVSGANH